jgi:hypothetical protein
MKTCVILMALSVWLPFPLLAGAGVWTGSGPANLAVMTIATDPLQPGTVYAGGFVPTPSAALFRSTDGGATWTPLPISVGNPSVNQEIVAVAVNPGPTVSTIYAAGYQSTDGTHWSPTSSYTGSAPSGCLAGLGRVPMTPATLFAFVGGGEFCTGFTQLHCSNLSMCLITPAIGPQTDYAPDPGGCGGPALGAIALVPSSPSILYAAYGSTITKITEGGQGVSNIELPPFHDLPPLPISALAVNPENPRIVLAGTEGSGIFRSTDGGGTWLAADEGFPATLYDQNFYPGVMGIVFDPLMPEAVYVGTNYGVFRSYDWGSTWSGMNEGLVNHILSALAIDSPGRLLYAGVSDSFGTGVFSYQLPSSPCADPNTLCLQGGRFQVSVQWTDFQGHSGLASVVPGVSSNDSGLMWFFAPDNWELLVKVLNGCGVNGHYWVFGAAATDVAYTIQVTDTQTGEIKTYTNPLGTSSPAITDTAAFGACP